MKLFAETFSVRALNLQGTSFPLADANGNAVSYIDEAGNVQAHCTYDAFGNTVSQAGAMADDFPFRFSSKYLDDETGLYYYGYRYYAPALGRWVSRDPIAEEGGLLLYGFVGNDGINKWDLLGQSWNWPWQGCCDDEPYNKLTQCCCKKNGNDKGEILNKKKIITGIRKCKITAHASAENGGSGWPHAWLEVGDFSAGFGPGSDTEGEVKLNDKRKGGTCVDIKLSPCKYDIELVKQTIISLSKAAVKDHPKYSPPFYMCYQWRQEIIDKGIKAGEGKCGM